MSTFRLKNNSIFRRKSYQIYDLNEGEVYGERFAESMKKFQITLNQNSLSFN